MTTILVTGATGTVGSHLVKTLAKLPGVTLRVAARDAAKAAPLVADTTATVVDFDWTRPASIDAAVAGVDRAFLLTPTSEDQVALGTRFVDAAKNAGVKHVVKLSSAGAEREPGTLLGRWHRDVEKHLEASGVAFTFLRPGPFMDNFITAWRPTSEGAVYMPLGTSASAFIDARDVAEAAAAALTTEGHEGKAYALTGPEALTTSEVATSLSAASRRAIQFVDVAESAARSGMKSAGLPEWMIQGLLELYALMKAGACAAVTEEAPRLMGRPGRQFDDFARAHAKAWKT